MTQMSRRTLARTASWTAPMAAVAAASPAIAASSCSSAAASAITNAFETVRAGGVTAYLSEMSAGNTNEVSKPVWVNLNNWTPYALTISADHPLIVRLDIVRENGTATAPGSGVPSTSWGSVTAMTGTTVGTQNARSTTWTLSGPQFRKNASRSDNEPDMTIQSGTPPAIIRLTLVSAPILVPDLANIQAVTGLDLTGCANYYAASVANAQPATITFAGPRYGSGAAATWGKKGSTYSLRGGSFAWTEGSSVWSNALGNYSSGAATKPDASGPLAYSYDGIF